MKKLFSIFLLTLFFSCIFSETTTAQGFEGVIHYEVAEMAKQGMDEMPYMIKGTKNRIEFGMGQQKGAMILLPDKSKMYVIVDQMKGYMEMDLDKNENSPEEMDNTEATNTGETKTIAGKTCEVWQMQSNKGTFENCMAKGMGTFMMPQNKMMQQEAPPWAKKFMEEGAVPLEVVKLNNGNRSVQMKATKIEEKSLSDDLFEVPEGYRDMSGMMQGMQNQN